MFYASTQMQTNAQFIRLEAHYRACSIDLNTGILLVCFGQYLVA
jgi:hypothetical protein